MAIERQTATPIEGTVEQDPQELEIMIENPEMVSIETDDGGMIIDFNPSAAESEDSEFNSNLADFVDEDELDLSLIHI